METCCECKPLSVEAASHITADSIGCFQVENGYHIYDFKGELLREEHIDKFKQFIWRSRPPTLLSKDDQKQIRKNLREYSKDFEEEDRIADDKEKGAVVEERRRMLSEWLAWRANEVEDLKAERVEAGLPEDPELDFAGQKGANGEAVTVVEEIVEEIVDETEEIMP